MRRETPRAAVAFCVALYLGRFALIMAGLWLAPRLGITGWWAGLFVNFLCCLYAAAAMTACGMWRSSGFLTPWRGAVALAAVVVLAAESLGRGLAGGLIDRGPGFGWWTLTLLLVGLNEEWIARGVALGRLQRNFSSTPAVLISAALFGLQHLSLLATTSRGVSDVLLNVAASAAYGVALAATQTRFAWLWPLVLVHAAADFTTILTPARSDLFEGLLSVAFVMFGLAVLRSARATDQRVDAASSARRRSANS